MNLIRILVIVIEFLIISTRTFDRIQLYKYLICIFLIKFTNFNEYNKTFFQCNEAK